MNPSDQYDEAYFLRGRETGVSLYSDYRWMPDMTRPMVDTIVRHLGIKRGELVLDYGCSRGYVVRALREMGIVAYGYDISKWAVENADETVYHWLTTCRETAFPEDPQPTYDWVIAKDVLEHVEDPYEVIGDLMAVARRGVFVVVPLSSIDGLPYVIPEYELDVTHRHRWSLFSWTYPFIQSGWSVTVQYRLPGVKDAWHEPGWECGNGFLTCRRLEG